MADDKLYHRRCFRVVQIQSINSESEIIGDYLNIYGELTPEMKNKGFFVHPFQGLVSAVETVPEVEFENETHDPVSVMEEAGSDIAESEDYSESLSIYDNSDNESDEISNLNSGEEAHQFPVDSEQANEIGGGHSEQANEIGGGHSEEEDSDIDNIIGVSQDISLKTLVQDTRPVVLNRPSVAAISREIIEEQRESGAGLPSCQENLVLSIESDPPVAPVKQRLYVKKRDKALPYSTFFEVPDVECVNPEFTTYPHDQRHQHRHQDDLLIRELPTTLSAESFVHKTPLKLKQSIDERMENMRLSTNPVKKLINIVPDPESESDVSSIEHEASYEIVEPQLIRDSIWRKPIISSVTMHRHRSMCVPIEGKFRDYGEFKDRLEELNAKQSDIEANARKIQQKLWKGSYYWFVGVLVCAVGLWWGFECGMEIVDHEQCWG